MSGGRKILVVRTDRIGDLILSTPLFRALKEREARCHVTAAAPPYALPVLEGNRSVDTTLPWKGGARAMARLLRARSFDAAIALDPGLSVCFALFAAGIPFRTGPLSRPSSFLFLNRGVRQRRSRAGRHQSDLDADFARVVAGGGPVSATPPFLALTDEEREAGAAILRGAGAVGRPLAGIHAGSGDSALRWPEGRFAETGRLLVEAGWSVALTGDRSEETLARRLAGRIGPGAAVVAGNHATRLFFGILAHLDLFLAPSTGPLHAAAALGVPVASPFPPLPSQSPARWGVRGGRAAVLTPPVVCPARTRCRGRRCPHHPCMEAIGPERLAAEALELARRERSRP